MMAAAPAFAPQVAAHMRSAAASRVPGLSSVPPAIKSSMAAHAVEWCITRLLDAAQGTATPDTAFLSRVFAAQYGTKVIVACKKAIKQLAALPASAEDWFLAVYQQRRPTVVADRFPDESSNREGVCSIFESVVVSNSRMEASSMRFVNSNL